MGRAPCCSKVGLKRGPWTVEEDTLLSKYIEKHGEGNWRILPKAAGLLRCGKSCRLRWINYLRPDVKRGNISEDEEELILKLHCLLGNRWSLIAGRIPGRTDNEIKNYWNSHLRKKQLAINTATRKLLPLSFNTDYPWSSSDQKNTPHELQTTSQGDTNRSNLSSPTKHDPRQASHLRSTVSSESRGTDPLHLRSRSSNNGSSDFIPSRSSALSSSSSISVTESLGANRPADQSCYIQPLDLPSTACMDCDSTFEYKSPTASFGCSSPSRQLYSEHPSSNAGEHALPFDLYAADSILTDLFPPENEPNSLEHLQSLDFAHQEMEFDSLWDTSNWVAANFWDLF